MLSHDHSLQSYQKDMGYTKRNRKGHAQESMMKKKREKKKEIEEEEERDSPYPMKRIKEMVHEKESIHHPPKISTNMHILIKLYDLFLLWIRLLT
jgi:hypothetical protein